jgi:alkanesulfonate monooxygenase SsuD/methylene tetrahydromethanopterin reductase-like flavin-dependent oxidoreductase (luciferase family)
VPHPPVWVEATSSGLIDFAARAGHTYLPSFLESTDTMKKRVGQYRQALAAAGRAATEVEWPVIRVCYVAATSEQARADTDGPLQELFAHYAGNGRLAAAEGGPVGDDSLSYEKLAAERAIIGDVDEVVDGVKRLYHDIGTNHFIACMRLPGLRHDKVLESIRLFNSEVWSRLQA